MESVDILPHEDWQSEVDDTRMEIPDSHFRFHKSPAKNSLLDHEGSLYYFHLDYVHARYYVSLEMIPKIDHRKNWNWTCIEGRLQELARLKREGSRDPDQHFQVEQGMTSLQYSSVRTVLHH